MTKYWQSAIFALVCVALVTFAACSDNGGTTNGDGDGHDHAAHADVWAGVDKAVARLIPTDGNSASGTITFEAVKDGVKVTAHVDGLTPNSKHGFHIHEFGDITAADGAAAGGHYNPEGHDHALPNGGARHAGDLGNLEADENGEAHYEQVFDNITLAGKTNPIIGRGVIVHAKEDDGGQPTGNAGARIGQGVIGIAKSE